MPRLPRGWGPYFHPQAARRGGSKLQFRPGYRGTGMQPIRRPPIQAYQGRAVSVPLTGGQAQGTVPGSGLITLLAGPQGLGTIWYPAQATIATTTGALDTSVALVYLGSGSVPSQLVGTVYSGNG